MAKSLDARFMSSNKSYEFQRANNFEVIIPSMGDEITLCVTRCTLPEMTLTPIEPSANSNCPAILTLELP